jgi:dipeptidyl aminopeptidase/acylaminoacyl peptidase
MMRIKDMRHFVRTVFCAFFLLILFSSSASFVKAGDLRTSQLLDIKYLSEPAWSPNGSNIAFIWDKGGVQEIWVSFLSDGKLTKISESKGRIVRPVWSPDGNLFYVQEGTLFFWKSAQDKGIILNNSPKGIDDFDISPNAKSIVYSKNGDLGMFSLENNQWTQLTSTPEIEFSPQFSPDGKTISFMSTPPLKQISEVSNELAGPKLAFLSIKYENTDVGIIPASGGAPVWVACSEENELSPKWSADSNKIVIEKRTQDCKKREIVVKDLTSNKEVVIYEEKTRKWIYELSQESYWSPRGNKIAFISDQDGWCHLYIYNLDDKKLTQVTMGEYEVSYPAWSPDGSKIAFTSNKGSLIERQIWLLSIPGGKLEKITEARGTNMMPLWSPEGKKIAFLHSDPYAVLDIWIKTLPQGESKQLTNAMPESLDKNSLTPPEFLYYESGDGLKIPAFLFKPKDFDQSQKYPAIIWIHGDGILQNRYGWHPSKHYGVYYGFHQYLLHKGYVVLSVDYRGSVGYGRDFMQGHYMDLGGKDCEDVIKGAEYLKSLNFVDPERIGVWGLSYGGYLTLQAIIRNPEMFKAAINVAGVDDWNDWAKDPDGWWIQGRMGNPEDHKELYYQSAPIHFVDKIKTPLLVLHGTADFNVPFYESVRLIDALIKKGKNIELMIYPGEDHYFVWNHTWKDVFQRVEKFFEKYLKIN